MTTTQTTELELAAAPAEAAPTSAAVPAAASAPAVTPPSIHVRALLTWIAIFPLVTLGLTVIAPFAEAWPPVVRSLVLTLVVVPLAVYLVVPQLLKAHGRLARRRAARRG
ncbi:hypothetical protein [Agromyces allii]|uniref:Uncharacterized protein n=1 Tax=Agromyces allii TaxID=393607 RepID=A0ABP5BBP0_9MICO|nr:hypothetical protein [Agromyces allii]